MIEIEIALLIEITPFHSSFQAPGPKVKTFFSDFMILLGSSPDS